MHPFLFRSKPSPRGSQPDIAGRCYGDLFHYRNACKAKVARILEDENLVSVSTCTIDSSANKWRATWIDCRATQCKKVLVAGHDMPEWWAEYIKCIREATANILDGSSLWDARLLSLVSSRAQGCPNCGEKAGQKMHRFLQTLSKRVNDMIHEVLIHVVSLTF